MPQGVLLQNAALVPPYSLYHLPPLVPGTNGWGLPKPDVPRVVCIAPGAAQTYNANWGQTLDLDRGYPHMALAPDDHYPNQVLVRDCIIGDPVGVQEPRAAALLHFWQDKGFTHFDLRAAWLEWLDAFAVNHRPKWWSTTHAAVEQGNVFFWAKKEQPVIVLGTVDLRFQTSEGATGLEHGMVIVVHPDDPTNTWAIRPHKFEKGYNWTHDPLSGLDLPS